VKPVFKGANLKLILLNFFFCEIEERVDEFTQRPLAKYCFFVAEGKNTKQEFFFLSWREKNGLPKILELKDN
jgi:hypothetical protein